MFRGWVGRIVEIPVLGRFIVQRAGNISVIMALTLVPLIGAVGMGAEATNWFLTQRAIQNAADAAALAAANNACDPTDACHTDSDSLQPSYDQEARSVSAKFGFAAGGDTSVSPLNKVACPSGGTDCYSVAITRKVPFSLLKIVGFTGDTTTTAGAAAQTVAAVAVARRFPGSRYCVTALSSADNAILINGGPNVHFENCDAFTPNGGARCNGISGGGAFRSSYMAVKPQHPCPNPTTKADAFVDNFSSLSSSIPTPNSTKCPGSTPYPQVDKKDVPTLPANKITTASQLNSYRCGDVRLENDITVTSDSTFIIYNGRLDLNGHTLQTSGAAGMTIIFSGTSTSSGLTSYTHSFMSSTSSSTAVLDIAAPSSGTWAEVAVYQDPRLTGSKNLLNFDASGPKLTMRLGGLLYAPKADVTFSGNVTYATTGKKCLAIIVKTLRANGSVNMGTSQCEGGGLPRVYDLVNLVA